MTVFEATVRRWGNSYAVRIPKELVEKNHLREGQRIALMPLRRPDPRAFGLLREWGLDPQRAKDELRRAHGR